MAEPSERGLFAPAHRADGCEPAPVVWLKLVVVEGVWWELEEPSDRGRFAPDTHRADGAKLSSVIWLRLAEVVEVKELVVVESELEVKGVEAITFDLVPEVEVRLDGLPAPAREDPEGPLEIGPGFRRPRGGFGILWCLPIVGGEEVEFSSR